MLSLDRRRAFGGMLWVAVAAGLGLYLHAVSYLLGDQTGDPFILFEMSLTMGYVAQVMPLVAALPFGGGFCYDIQAGYAGAAALRAGKSRYLTSTALAAALSGGLASALAMLAFLLVSYLRFPGDFAQPEMLELTYLHSLLAGGGLGAYLKYYAARLALSFLSGSFWALCALCFSAFYPSLPLALVCPLALWRLALEAAELLRLPAWLDLAMLEDGSAALAPVPLLLSALALYGGLGFVLALVFRRRGRRRLSYER